MLVNWDSIMSKCQASVSSPEMQSNIDNAVGKIMFGISTKPGSYNIYEVGDTFAAVLWDNIQGAPLPARVIELLADIVVKDPTDNGDGTFSITVTWGGDLDRSSMSTKKDYGYDINLAALYNNGVDHVMKQIFETRGNMLMVSSTFIPSTNFIENAINEFMSQYGNKYHVISIQSSFGD